MGFAEKIPPINNESNEENTSVEIKIELSNGMNYDKPKTALAALLGRIKDIYKAEEDSEAPTSKDIIEAKESSINKVLNDLEVLKEFPELKNDITTVSNEFNVKYQDTIRLIKNKGESIYHK